MVVLTATGSAAPPNNGCKMSNREFNARLAAARRGDRIIYHIGDLATDRVLRDDHRKIHALANMVYDLAELGTLALVQRKVNADKGVYEYIAVKL